MAHKLFITGATGYIGGSILTGLLQYPNQYEISALVRTKEQGEVLRKFGVEPILGSLEDSSLLTQVASESHIVINAADADHFEAVKSLVHGLKSRNDPTAIFLHTSGTGLLTFSGEKITTPYDDSDIETIHAIPKHASHKVVDTWIYENTEDLRAAIIAPSCINGIGSGFFNKNSMQIIVLAQAAAARGKAGWAGDRKDAVWNNVNIHDLVDLYLLVLAGLINGTASYGKKGGWYFGSAHEHSWHHASELIAKELLKLGLVKTEEVSQFESEYVDKFLWGQGAKRMWTGDSRAVATRSLSLGWKPHRPNVYETLHQEIEYIHKTGKLTSN